MDYRDLIDLLNAEPVLPHHLGLGLGSEDQRTALLAQVQLTQAAFPEFALDPAETPAQALDRLADQVGDAYLEAFPNSQWRDRILPAFNATQALARRFAGERIPVGVSHDA